LKKKKRKGNKLKLSAVFNLLKLALIEFLSKTLALLLIKTNDHKEFSEVSEEFETKDNLVNKNEIKSPEAF